MSENKKSIYEMTSSDCEMMQIEDPRVFQNACEKARQNGKRVGLVPTMGALHEGHLSLIQEAKKHADFLVVTIFVNPTQFAAHEDLSKYPRTLEDDLKKLDALGVDLAFTPTVETLYPSRFQTFVEVTELTQILEGKFRPTHFRGVTTIVMKLFNLTGPCTSVFGRKDYQQLAVIQQMVRDLHIPTTVIGAPIVRDRDGLALSSRNQYLSDKERKRALSLSHSIELAKKAFEQGEKKPNVIEKIVQHELKQHVDQIDYACIVHPETLLPISESDLEAEHPPTPIILIAAHVGSTRLIDNSFLELIS